MNGHEFRTVEALLEPHLSQYGVRRSSTGTLAPRKFSRAKFSSDVRDVLFRHKGPLDETALDALVDRSLSALEQQLTHRNLTLTSAEIRIRPDIVGAIPDELISTTVEEVLRHGRGRSYRMAELLYVTAVRGRADYREGWSGAKDVLTWIQDRYAHVQVPSLQKGFVVGEPEGVARTSWRPQTVLKRRHHPVPFDTHQFHKSLLGALHGREHATAKATKVVHHVLGEIQGQRVIHSSQLASSALTSLRRVDDIAYLRWATVVKGITSVRAFTDEVADLIQHPSPPLLWL